MSTPLITIEYEDPIDGAVEARFAQECDALSFEEMLDAEGAWHRRVPPAAERKSPLGEAVERARGGHAPIERKGYA